MQTDVFHDIRVERARQDVKHGGRVHDDQHRPMEWASFITARATVHPMASWRQRMIEIAALAVAAVESYDRLHPTPPIPGNFVCPRCVGSPLIGEHQTPHRWQPIAGWPAAQGPTPHICTGCGSLKPEDALRLMQAGFRAEKTDKSYKGYLHAPQGQTLGHGPGKFYLQHFSPAQIDQLNTLHAQLRAVPA